MSRQNAIGYVRVSTDEQARKGISLDTQRTTIANFARFKRWKLLPIFQDRGVSGRKSSNRPGLQAAVAMAVKKRCPLIVYSLIRFARSTRECLDLTERLSAGRADLVSISESIDTTSAAGKFFFTILAALAQFESDLISEHTRAALAHLRAPGRKWTYWPPYGYAFRKNRLVPNPRERRVVARVIALREGPSKMGFLEIAQKIEAAGIRNRAGNPFTREQLSSLLIRHEKWRCLDVRTGSAVQRRRGRSGK